MKYTTKGLSRVLMAVITMAMFLPLSTQAQTVTEKYTLTNGRLWWFDGTESDSDAEWTLGTGGRKIPVAFDTVVLDGNGNPSYVYISGEPQNTITHIVERGQYYLALEPNMTDPTHTTITAHILSPRILLQHM